MNLKELVEKRNEKVTEMENILNLAKKENRAVTDEEKANFDNLQKEINKIDNTISMEETVNKMELKRVPEAKPEMSVENKERKTFENQLRGIVNVDTPTTVSDGQVTIPQTIAQKIIDRVVEISPVLQMAERYNIKGKLVIPKYDKDNSSIVMTYATEGTSADSGKVALTSIELNGFLGRCLAKVSKSLINNSQFDIVSFVIEKMSQAIATFIEGELLKGTSQKVEGLSGIATDMVVTSAKATEITADELIDLQDKVVDNYQANSIWIMNRATRSAIRKLKDGDGNYLLNKDLTSTWGYTLLGKPVYTSDAVDTIASEKTPIYYGDLSGLAVKVSENINMQVLNERYAEEHMTGILAFIEFDSKVQDTQKLAKLKMKKA